MIKLNLKANKISLTMSSDLLYFNFTKSCQKTLETMNVSNLSLNNVNISLANYVRNKTIEIYLSIPQCARGRSLLDPLK